MIYLVTVTVLIFVGRFPGVTNDKVEMSKGVCDTTCLNGFIRESDSCSFTCTVTLDEKPKIGASVRFQIKRKWHTSIQDLAHFDLSGECFENYKAIYQCRKVEEKVFNLSYAVRASNYEKIRCKMQNIRSNEEWFPQLYDPTEAKGVLHINGRKLLNERYCDTTIDSNDFSLEFDCLSLATPCVVEINVNNTVVVFQRKNNVVFNETLTNEANFTVTVKYAACRLDGTHKVIHCRIQPEFVQINDRIKSDENSMIIILPVAAFVLILLFLIFIIRRCKRKDNNRTEINDAVNNMDQTMRSTPGKARLKRKAIFDEDDTDVWTPLMLAANKCHTSTVSKLITNGAEVNARGPEELSALMLASENGYLAIVKKLVKSGANVNDKDCEGWTALMLASQNGHVDIVKYLIKNKANVDEQNNDDLTAMIIASQNDQTHISDLLDKIGRNPEKKKYKKSLTRKSTIYESRSFCVMDNTINIDKGNINNINKDIINAIEIGSTENVERILKEGFDVNKQLGNGSNALIFAAIKGRIEIVDLLIQNKADVNDMDKNGFTALLHASEHGQTDVVKLLLEKGANDDKKENKSWTDLMLACQNGHTDTARLLIKNGANVNDKQRQGWTALMLACLHGYKETVQLLIGNGADLEQRESDGWTALMHASRNGHVETISLLLEHGAQITKNETNGLTPLMLASQNGHAKVVQLLLDNGADANETECSGFTALMLASQNGHLETAKLLIDKGANIHLKNSDDWTALMCAADNGHDAVVDLLSHSIHV